MKRRTKSTKTPKWSFFIMGIVLGALVIYLILMLITNIGYSNIKTSTDYKIYVKSNVINTLNSEYTKNLEQAYCIDGTIDDNNKIITITNLTKQGLSNQEFAKATTSERYACAGKLGLIHTHPKYLGIFPICEFSEADLYTLGEMYGHNKNRVGGVYCDKNKIAFYISNNEINEDIFFDNRRIGYELI